MKGIILAGGSGTIFGAFLGALIMQSIQSGMALLGFDTTKQYIALGIVLMAISPGAPVALRRALDAGGSREFAPALHLAIVMLAVVTVPASIATARFSSGTTFSDSTKAEPRASSSATRRSATRSAPA